MEGDRLVLGYERGGYIRETWIRPHGAVPELSADGIVFTPEIGPQAEWSAWIEVVTAVDGTPFFVVSIDNSAEYGLEYRLVSATCSSLQSPGCLETMGAGERVAQGIDDPQGRSFDALAGGEASRENSRRFHILASPAPTD